MFVPVEEDVVSVQLRQSRLGKALMAGIEFTHDSFEFISTWTLCTQQREYVVRERRRSEYGRSAAERGSDVRVRRRLRRRGVRVRMSRLERTVEQTAAHLLGLRPLQRHCWRRCLHLLRLVAAIRRVVRVRLWFNARSSIFVFALVKVNSSSIHYSLFVS